MIDQLKPLNNYGSLQTGDEFAYPALFPWNSDLNIIKDPAPSADEFSQREYDLLLANLAPFWKFLDEFLSMDFSGFIQVIDPLKVKIGKRERKEGEAKILEAKLLLAVLCPSFPLLPLTQKASLRLVLTACLMVLGAEITENPRRAVILFLNRVREDYATPSGPTTSGKSQAVLYSLLADARLNVEIRVSPIPTMPFITSFVSVTPDSSHHSSTHHADTEVDSHVRSLTISVPVMTQATTTTTVLDPIAVAQEKPVSPSPFLTGSHSIGRASPSARGFTDLTGSDFVVGGFHTVVNPDADLQKVYVPKWNVTNGSGVDTATDCRETVDELALQCFFAIVRNMEHDQLFTEFNVGTARQVCLSVEVRTRAEFSIRERRRLSAKCEEQESLLVQTNEENASLKKQLLLKEAEAVEAIRLRGQAYAFEATEKSLQEEVKLLRERSLAAYNPSTDADYDAAMQQFRDVSFSLLSELKSRKDASIE
ncbi:hypothetical protein Tco_1442900, partial [Tanacetum coccineum]